MARRGFFAELHRIAKQAERDRARAQREAERAYKAAIREAERARRAEERAEKELARANDQERKRLAQEAKEAHLRTMEARVETHNLELRGIYEDIDSLLAATLDVDDYVNLETLRVSPQHPPFDRSDLEVPIPLPQPPSESPQPVCVLPEPPKGLRALIGKKNHEAAVSKANRDHKRALGEWQRACASQAKQHEILMERHARDEAQRLQTLGSERARYQTECAAREAEAAKHNSELDELIVNLGYGTAEAVQEYVSIVLSNTVYPPHFQCQHEFTFDPRAAELRLRVAVPPPSALTSVKQYKYSKGKDEITSSSLPQKVCKERYASAVHQVALRSLHEVFEADRRGLIQTIALEVGTETTDPATGLTTFLRFVAAGAARQPFLELNLAAVVPSATLAHLGAAVSSNPYGLVTVEASGIRQS